MNSRHVAALALVGWYLMVPPMQYGDDPNHMIQIGRWNVSKSFDSATACERARKLMVAKGSKYLVNEEGLRKEDWQLFNKFSSPALPSFTATKPAPEEFAVCIATDDPRLKEK